MAILNLDEIRQGLVAHLCPKSLREYGADRCLVEGKHDFLILGVDDDDALMLPLTSKTGRGRGRREMIPQFVKHGHERWTEPRTFVLGKPFWAPCHAVQEASEHEFSHVNERNSVDTKWCEDWLSIRFALTF